MGDHIEPTYQLINDWLERINSNILRKVHLKMTFDPVNLEDHERAAFSVRLFPLQLVETTLLQYNHQEMATTKERFCTHLRGFYGTAEQSREAKEDCFVGQEIHLEKESSSSIEKIQKQIPYHFLVLDYKYADKIKILKFRTFQL